MYSDQRYKALVERVNVTGTVLGCLRSRAPHVSSVHKDDMMSTSLTFRFLTAKVTSTFAILTQVTNTL